MVERGRWLRPKLELHERNCPHCDNCLVVEDEYHCLVECPRFNHIHRKYLPQVLKFRLNMQTFISEIKLDRADNLFKMALLCFHVLKDYTVL